MFDITNPLVGTEGTDLRIVCGARQLSGSYRNPAEIMIMRDGAIYTAERLRSSTNTTHKTYTLQDLLRSDSGARIQCAISELASEVVPIDVQCECLCYF